MQEQIVNVKDLINSYDLLNISDKRKELGREIEEVTLVIQKLLTDVTAQDLFSDKNLNEFNNLYNGLTPEGEYLTGLYEDVLNLKELLGMYLNKVMFLYYGDKQD